MLFFIRRILIIIPLTAGSLACWNWFLRPQVSSEAIYAQQRFQLADQWAQQSALAVGRLPDRPLVAVGPTVNDDEGLLEERLRGWIARQNCRIAPNPLNLQWRKDLGLVSPVRSSEESRRLLLKTGADFVVVATVDEWTTYPSDNARLSGHLHICDGNTGHLISEETITVPQFDRPAIGWDVPEESGLNTGFLIWCALVTLLPIAGSSFLGKMLMHRSNRVNGILLSGWVVLNWILAGMTWLPSLSLNSAMLLGFAAISASAGFFGYYCHCLEKSL